MSSDLTFICNIEVLVDPGSYGFEVEHQGETVAGFLVHHQGQLFAYRNSCPHTGALLDWVDHQFLDVDGALIQCAVHDARFLIDSGECVSGPCPGQSLSRLKTVVEIDKIYLTG